MPPIRRPSREERLLQVDRAVEEPNMSFHRRALVLTVALVACTATAAAAEVIVSGRVLSPGGLPFPDAEVRLLSPVDPVTRFDSVRRDATAEAAATARTGPDGVFHLVAPAPGVWRVRVEAPGFVPAEAALEPLLDETTLPDLELDADTGLVVRVMAPGDRPVEGAVVRFGAIGRTRVVAFFDRGPAWGIPERLAITDAEGTARVPRARSDRGAVSAHAPGHDLVVRRDPRGDAIRLNLPAAKSRPVQVLDDDGAALVGALLSDADSGHPLASTGDDGLAAVPVRGGGRQVGVETSDGRDASGRVVPAPPEEGPQSFSLPGLHSIAGRVVDAETREAIDGAVVWPESRGWQAVAVDRAGGFVLSGPLGSRMRIATRATGYLAPRSWVAELVDDGRPGPTLALSPAAGIAGRVVDPAGNGIPEARVSVELKPPSSGMMVIRIGGGDMPLASTVTDERGRFRLTPVDPDNAYLVQVEAEGYADGRVEVAGLEPRRVKDDVRIELAPGVSAVGRVTDEDGAALSDATVTLTAAPEAGGSGGMHRRMIMAGGGDEDGPQAITGDDGSFRFDGLQAGTFDLEARRSGYAPAKARGLIVDEGDEPTDLGAVEMQIGARVEGVVLDLDGYPVEGANVTAAPAQGGGMAMMMGLPGAGGEPDAVTGADGWFAVEDLEPGTPVNVTVHRTGFVKRTENGVDVPLAEPLTIKLDPSSEVSGIVLDSEGEPIPRASVTLTRTMTGGGGGRMISLQMQEESSADDDGRFRFEDVEPGKISLSASATGWQEANRDGIEVPKGEDVTGIELPLQPGAILVGRVTAPDGRGAVGASVREVGGDGRPFGMPQGAPTDGEGYYRLEGLAPEALSIEVTHESYVRTVKDIDAEPGINHLDFEFEGGQEVGGTVVDTSGGVVVGASVQLMPAGRRWGGPDTTTGGDGRFRFEGVADGDYTLRVGADGFAPYIGPDPVKIEGQPRLDLQVAMQAGAAITGRLSGLQPDELGRVEIDAMHQEGHGWGNGGSDAEGHYRIEGLAPGPYRVVARVGNTGRQTKGEVEIPEGSDGATLDLAFGEGVALTGRAVLGEQPFSGAAVYARGTEIDASGWGETDREGRFRVEGLEAGTFKVDLQHWQSGVSHSETVEVAADREVTLTIPTATVSGRIIDTADRTALTGVRVQLTSPGGNEDSFMNRHAGISDVDGNFRIGNVPDGSWLLTSSLEGYATDTSDVVVQDGRDVGDVRIDLDPTEGLTVLAQMPNGRPPESVQVAVLDGAGRAVTAGNYRTGENGAVRLKSVPPGSWDLVIGAHGTGTLQASVTAPGTPVTLRLPESCTLEVRVPDLEGSGLVATATLTDGSGRPFRMLGWLGDPTSEWRFSDGRLTVSTLPPGPWTVRVRAPDGRTWEGSATTTPGAAGQLDLP